MLAYNKRANLLRKAWITFVKCFFIRQDIQHNDTWRKDINHNTTKWESLHNNNIMLSVIYKERSIKPIMLSVVTLNAIRLSVAAPFPGMEKTNIS